MATYRVKIMEVPETKPGAPPGVPVEVPGFAVDADGLDEGKELARRRLTAPDDHGYILRALNWSTTPNELLAYVVAKT